MTRSAVRPWHTMTRVVLVTGSSIAEGLGLTGLLEGVIGGGEEPTGRGFIGGGNQHTDAIYLHLRVLASGIIG